jgi:glycine cleavage system H protein
MHDEFPEDLLYSEEHMWIRFEDGVARIGITDVLIDRLGQIMEVELPEEEQELRAASELGHITGSKEGALEIFSPLNGTVIAVNDELFDTPEIISKDPYDEGWLLTLTGFDPDEFEELYSPEDYQELANSIDE